MWGKSTKTTFYLILILLFSGNLYAQNLKICGQLTTNDNGSPVIGATLVLANTGKGCTTDAMGNFHLNGLSQGNYLLKISCLGFEKVEREIYLKEDLKINLSLKYTSIELGDVTVSQDNNIKDGETVSGVDKLLRPVNTAQDLLQLVPGLFIAQHAGGGKAEQIFLRGFDCDHGTDFNISVDGMPVNMVSHAHGQGYADFHFVIPETIDRLNVYKGPYTTRFGDFATSGTGEYFTKNSIDKNEVKAEAGMFDSYRAFGMFKLLDKKHLFSDGKENAYIAGENVFTNSYFDKKQNFKRYNLFGKYSGMLNERNYLTFSASTFSAGWDASGQIPQRAIDEGLIDRFGSIDPSEGGQTQRTNINTTLTTTGNGAIIKNQLYFVNYFFNLYSDFTYFLNDPVHGDEINQTDRRNIGGYTGSFQKDILLGKKALHVMTGIGSRNDFTKIALRHTEQRMVLDTVVSGKVYQQNTNAFLDLTLDLNNQLSINAGVRLDYFQFHYSDDRTDSISGTRSILRASPKLNFYYKVNDDIKFYLRSGIGFHSNDARSVVINHTNNNLPKAYGSELGSEFKLKKRIFVNVAVWNLYLQSELVYAGDEGTVETNHPTERFGTDLSIRYQVTDKLFADADLNFNHGRMMGVPEGENYIPLAPRLTSIAGLTYKKDIGINASLRYRFIDSRPANETNSVTAKGYFLLDAVLSYKLSKFEFGLSAENLLNRTWNQAQFDTQSRLINETVPVTELHFTPGTPFFLKGKVAYYF